MEELQQNNTGVSAGTYFSSTVSRAQPSRVSQVESNRYETETNPGSNPWVNGNEAVSLVGSEYSAVPSQGYGRATGTGWEGFPGGGRHRTTPSGVSKNSGGFVKQGAVGKDIYQKATEQIERDKALKEQHEEKLQREDSDDDSEADDDPY